VAQAIALSGTAQGAAAEATQEFQFFNFKQVYSVLLSSANYPKAVLFSQI